MVEGIFHVTDTDSKKFCNTLVQVIAQLQNSNLEPEFQYSTAIVEGLSGTKVQYSCLVVGKRKQVEEVTQE